MCLLKISRGCAVVQFRSIFIEFGDSMRLFKLSKIHSKQSLWKFGVAKTPALFPVCKRSTNVMPLKLAVESITMAEGSEDELAVNGSTQLVI